jgi:hypothetical protein
MKHNKNECFLDIVIRKLNVKEKCIKVWSVVGRTLDFTGTFFYIKNLGEGLGDRVQVTEKTGQQAGHRGWETSRVSDPDPYPDPH